MYSADEIVDRIREVCDGLSSSYALSKEECSVIIGQYAYRYCEEIRKDRDEWKKLALSFKKANLD